jgi:excisionase family DNA binding protein
MVSDNNGNGQHPRATPDDLAAKQVFTTGEAAEVCRVSQQTIIRCFDSGRLRGFRVPGSKFRRIPRDELVRFMRENNIPTDELQGGAKRVLVVDDDANIVDLLIEVLQRSGQYEVRSASTGYEAGMLTEQFKPDLVLLDYMLPDLNGSVVCRAIRQNPLLAGTKVVIVSGVVKPADVEELMRAGADDFVKKPFNIDALQARIGDLLGV